MLEKVHLRLSMMKHNINSSISNYILSWKKSLVNIYFIFNVERHQRFINVVLTQKLFNIWHSQMMDEDGIKYCWLYEYVTIISFEFEFYVTKIHSICILECEMELKSIEKILFFDNISIRVAIRRKNEKLKQCLFNNSCNLRRNKSKRDQEIKIDNALNAFSIKRTNYLMDQLRYLYGCTCS